MDLGSLAIDDTLIKAVMIIVILAVLLINFKKMVRWIKPAIEGEDGKLDNKEFSLFVFTMLFAFEVVSTGVFGSIYPDSAWYITAIGAGILSAVNAYSMIHGGKS